MFTKEEILNEVAKLQYLYGLKKVIRYHHIREEVFDTESVAEHIFGMQLLCEYFLPLEDHKGEWDHAAIHTMILFHDMDEIETGDTIGYLKTDVQRQEAARALETAIEKVPSSMKERVKIMIEQYESQATIEARFVKALDRLEPGFQLYCENGKRICLANKTTYEQHNSIKVKYVEPFPYIKHFSACIGDAMREEGFFAPSPVIELSHGSDPRH